VFFPLAPVICHTIGGLAHIIQASLRFLGILWRGSGDLEAFRVGVPLGRAVGKTYHAVVVHALVDRGTEGGQTVKA
jgi:hypothetical protein